MFVWCVDIRVRGDREEEFLEAIRHQAEVSRTEEAGCLRFEILHSKEDPLSFRLVEVYASEDDYRRFHRETPHFAEWLATADRVLDGERVASGYLPIRLEISPDERG